MDLVGHFRAIARNWWRILIVSAVVAGAVYVLDGQRADVFQASTFLRVEPGRAQDALPSQDDAVFLAATYSELAGTKPLLRDAVAAAGLDISPREAEDLVDAIPAGDLGFITIDARGPTASESSGLANAVAEVLIQDVVTQQQDAIDQQLGPVRQQIQDVQAELDALPADASERASLEARYQALLQVEFERTTQPRNSVAIVSRATPPGEPYSPRPRRDAVLAFLVALVLSAEAAVAIRALGDRFTDSEDMDEIARFTGLPVLAAIPRGTEAEAIEAFRILRTGLLAVPAADRPRTVAVVSSQPGEGKSFTALNLARVAAQLDSTVVLVDADLRRPVIHLRLDLPREPGLTDVLAGADPDSVMRKVVEGEIRFRVRESGAPLSERPTQYRVMPSGAAVTDPSSALGGRTFPRMLDTLDQPEHLVVVDTPPASMFADSLTVAAACDVTVLVLDVHTSRQRVVKRTIQSFQQVGAHLAGIVVNRVEAPKTSYYATRKGDLKSR